MIMIPKLTSFETQYVIVLLISVQVLLFVVLSLILGSISHRLSKAEYRKAIFVFCVVLPLWFGVCVAVSMTQYLDFKYFLPFALVPIFAGTVLAFTTTGRSVLVLFPVATLVAVQFYRVLGGLFIHPYHTSGLLSNGFAMNAGIGDIITGVLALPVAYLLYKRAQHAGKYFIAWTIFGVGDLIVAPLSALIYGFGTKVEYEIFPVSLIPLFLGPPFGILIHVVTLRAYWLQRNMSYSHAGDSEK